MITELRKEIIINIIEGLLNSLFLKEEDKNFNKNLCSSLVLIDFKFRGIRARFVLTGSLHSAMTAYAYKVPFGLFAADYVDFHFKWEDWTDTVCISPLSFLDKVHDVRHWYPRSVSIWRGIK